MPFQIKALSWVAPPPTLHTKICLPYFTLEMVGITKIDYGASHLGWYCYIGGMKIDVWTLTDLILTNSPTRYEFPSECELVRDRFGVDRTNTKLLLLHGGGFVCCDTLSDVFDVMAIATPIEDDTVCLYEFATMGDVADYLMLYYNYG